MSEKLRSFYDAAIEKLDEIDDLMLPGAKITLIIRRPGHVDADVLITADEPAEIVALVERRYGPTARDDTKILRDRLDG